MKKLFSNKVFVTLVAVCLTIVLFFLPNLVKSKIPFPADSLVGLYHPFRDVEIGGYFPGRYPVKNPLITDPVLQIYPWRYLTIQLEKAGQFPFWNSFSFSGQPLLANIQSAPFSIFNILFFILPFKVAWTTQIILAQILMAVFTFFFLRESKFSNLKFTLPTAAFAALTISMSGFFIAWLEWGTITSTALWLPAILLSIEKLFKNFKPFWFLALTFACSQTLLNGHLQTAFYVIIAAFLFVLFKIVKNAKSFSNVLVVFLGFFIAFIIAAPQLLPSFEFIKYSARSLDQTYSEGRQDWFIPPVQSLQVIAPDYFGNPTTNNYWGVWNYAEFVSFIGVVPFFLALYYLISTGRRLSFPGILLALAALFAFKNPISVIPYELNFPFVATIQPSRIIFLIDFALTILAGLGLNLYLEDKSKNKKLFSALTVLALLLIAAFFSLFFKNSFPVNQNFQPSEVAVRNIVLPLILSVIIVLTSLIGFFKNKKYILITFFCLTIFDLFRFAYKFTPFTNSSLIYPKTESLEFLQKQQKPFRIMATDRRIFPPNVSAYYNLESIEGYDPLYLLNYARFISSLQSSKYQDNPSGYNRIITPQRLDTPLIDLLNVKYVLSFDQITNPRFKKVLQEGSTIIYENINVLPRAFFVNKVIKENEKNSLPQMANGILDLKKVAVSNEFEFMGGETEKSLQIKSYSTNQIKIKTITKSESPLIITTPYYPGWNAKIDGLETKIKVADIIFQSVIVPAGEHEVEFFYVPSHWQLSLMLSAIGISSMLLVLFYSWKKRSR